MKIEKLENFVANLHNKKEHAIHIRNLRQTNHRLFLNKVHRAIRFNQKTWPKSYIDMNIELRKNLKNNLKKIFQGD